MAENKSKLSIVTNGLLKENPTLRLVLGTCPTLAVTTAVSNALGMGAAATVVLICSNFVISALRKVIPDKVRIPAFIVIICTFVTIIQLLMQAFLPSLSSSLGLFIPLIVVNCIVLGRAESFASKNKALPSMLDGLGIGLGFTMALTILGAIREILGSGKFFNMTLYNENYGMLVFVLAPGAFIALGYLIAFINRIRKTN